MKGKTEVDYLVRDKIADILIECRKEKGLTQAELAKELGFSPTGIAAWEQKKSLPSVDQLYRLAKYYGKTISYMYGEEAQSDEEPIFVVYQGKEERRYSKEELELIRDVFKHGTLPGIQADSDSVIWDSRPTGGDAGDKGEDGQN